MDSNAKILKRGHISEGQKTSFDNMEDTIDLGKYSFSEVKGWWEWK